MARPRSSTFASRSGFFLLDLLKGAANPFKRGIGTGQQAVAQRAGISPEELSQRAQALQQKGGLAGILGKLSLATQLRPEEATELQQTPVLSTAKTLAGQGAFFVPGGTGVRALATTGAVAGGLTGFGASRPGEELSSTVGGAGTGLAFGVAGGLLGKFAQKFKASRQATKVTDTGITGAKLKNDPFFLKNRTQLRKVGSGLGFKKGQTPTQQLKLVQGAFDDAQGGIKTLLKGADPIKEDVLLDDFVRNLQETEFVDTTKAGKEFSTTLLNRLEKTGGDPLKVSKLKSDLRGELARAFNALDKGNLPSKPDQAKMALWRGLKESLDGVSTQVRNANNFQKQLWDLSEEVTPRIKGDKPKSLKITFPVEINIPTGVSEQQVGAVGGKVGGLLESALGLPGRAVGAVARPAARVTGQPQVRAGILNQILQAGGQQPEAQVPEPAQPTTQPQVDETQLPQETQNALATVRQAREQAQGGGAGGLGEIRITPEQAVLAQLTLPTEQAAAVQRAFQTQQSAIEFEQKQQLTQAKLAGGGQLSGAERREKRLAQSGIRALDEVDEILEENPNVFIQASTPGKLGTPARKYDSASFRAVEGLLRSRSGAAVPETEVRRYMNANLPRIGDSQEAARFKLDAFRKDLEAIANIGEPGGTPGTGGTDQDAILQLLQSQGLDLSSF